MNQPLFFALVIVCTITHVIRTVYEILKHKKLLKPSRFSFLLVFTNMAALWISWFVLCSLDTFHIDLGGIWRYLGGSLVMLGTVAFFTALFTIRTLEGYEGDLISHGIYSRIRHPMYLGFILWLLGMPVVYGSIFSGLLGLAFIANVLYWRHLEELELVGRFPAYRSYREKTLF
jgi:protein-S-isoprenylcysteine O-methyltransferase Ste14